MAGRASGHGGPQMGLKGPHKGFSGPQKGLLWSQIGRGALENEDKNMVPSVEAVQCSIDAFFMVEQASGRLG